MSKWVLPAAVGAAFGVYYLMNRKNPASPLVGNVGAQAIQAATPSVSTPVATVGGAGGFVRAPAPDLTSILRSTVRVGIVRAPAAAPPTMVSNPPPAGTAPGGQALGAKDYATAAAAAAGSAAAVAGCTAVSAGVGAIAAPLCGAIGGYVGTQAVNLGDKAWDATSSWVSGLF
jgi:hypothetical protein